jgi:hypothetical protein
MYLVINSIYQQDMFFILKFKFKAKKPNLMDLGDDMDEGGVATSCDWPATTCAATCVLCFYIIVLTCISLCFFNHILCVIQSYKSLTVVYVIIVKVTCYFEC